MSVPWATVATPVKSTPTSAQARPAKMTGTAQITWGTTRVIACPGLTGQTVSSTLMTAPPVPVCTEGCVWTGWIPTHVTVRASHRETGAKQVGLKNTKKKNIKTDTEISILTTS